MFTKRSKCIFCRRNLTNRYFENDLEIAVAEYCVPVEEKESLIIPYNISVCDNCFTPQTIYLGPLDIIYKSNHVDSIGKTMMNMHSEFKDFIIKDRDCDIKNIIEIGASVGLLSDLILDSGKFNVVYNIVEPSYTGTARSNKNIINDFYENVNDSVIDANTLIMSHVFEHFYEPLDILEKIAKNKNITNIFISNPDFEYYIENNMFHVLNTEHTYYNDNQFLVDLFGRYGFKCLDRKNYNGHSVFFYFKRSNDIIVSEPKNINIQEKLNGYFNNVKGLVKKYNQFLNENENVYMFPCSINSTFLFIFGLDYKRISGLLDNSPRKINKKIYGYDVQCKSFKVIVNDLDSNACIILSGLDKCNFYNEIIEDLEKNNIKYTR
jgi:hypothetical protein